MNNNNPDMIILYGVPKGQGLHGLTPSRLPVNQLAPKEEIKSENPNGNSGWGVVIALAALFLIFK